MMRIAALVLPALLAACNTPVRPDTRSFDWLAGCWRLERADGSVYDEMWLPPAPDGSFGLSREVRGGKTVGHEFLEITQRPGGRFVYVARPSGQAAAEFPLVAHEAGRLVFENPRHDFPQRIEYRFVALNALTARVEGARDGRTHAIDYPMRRVDCEG